MSKTPRQKVPHPRVYVAGVRMSLEQKALIDRAAKAAQRSMSQWMLIAALEALKRK